MNSSLVDRSTMSLSIQHFIIFFYILYSVYMSCFSGELFIYYMYVNSCSFFADFFNKIFLSKNKKSEI